MEPLRSPPKQVMTPPVADPSWLQKKASDRLVATSVSLAEMNRVPLGSVSLTTIALTGIGPEVRDLQVVDQDAVGGHGRAAGLVWSFSTVSWLKAPASALPTVTTVSWEAKLLSSLFSAISL